MCPTSLYDTFSQVGVPLKMQWVNSRSTPETNPEKTQLIAFTSTDLSGKEIIESATERR